MRSLAPLAVFLPLAGCVQTQQPAQETLSEQRSGAATRIDATIYQGFNAPGCPQEDPRRDGSIGRLLNNAGAEGEALAGGLIIVSDIYVGSGTTGATGSGGAQAGLEAGASQRIVPKVTTKAGSVDAIFALWAQRNGWIKLEDPADEGSSNGPEIQPLPE